MGKKCWLIPDCELPPEGEGALKGHESVIIVNDSDKDAEIAVRIFYVDRDPCDDVKWTVKAGRVRCFRMNSLEDMCGVAIPRETQYAMKLVSDQPVVVQYGRPDNRQTNLSYYTTLGYAQ